MLAVEQIHFCPGDIFNKQIFNPITTTQFVAVECFEASSEELPLVHRSDISISADGLLLESLVSG